MPSGLDALAKMGLSAILEQVPHRQFDQAEREPEIIRAQQLQAEILQKYVFIRPLMFQVARLFRNKIRQSWISRQHDMRVGVTQVQLNV